MPTRPPTARSTPIAVKVGATAALILLVELVIEPAAILLPLAALGWIAALALIRPAVLRHRAAAVALGMAALFAATLAEDPGPLAVLLFLIAITLAALLPRRGFDDALRWAARIVWLGATAPLLPLRDRARIERSRSRRPHGVGIAAVAAMLVLPIAGGALFLMLFASANPLIARAFAGIVLPDTITIVWRAVVAVVVLLPVWATLRPNPRVTAWAGDGAAGPALPQPGLATLILSLATFNAIFAAQNALDIAFLWSGAALPAGVTMADYAHRGAYALIVTALLAGLFVLVTLRPGSEGAASPAVRRLVAVWIVQNLLLVASSALRLLDYVDAYSMTQLRLAALLWMALVATGLVLILWRLLTGRSAAWLINANALAAAAVLTACTIVDLGAVAAAWNVRVAIAERRPGDRIDTCYLASLGPPALVPLARLERQTQDPALRDTIAALRWDAQSATARDQHSWNGWTWRNARRLAAAESIAGTRPPRLRPAPDGRSCGRIDPPAVAPVPVPATHAVPRRTPGSSLADASKLSPPPAKLDPGLRRGTAARSTGIRAAAPPAAQPTTAPRLTNGAQR